jgi:hypothetical protein
MVSRRLCAHIALFVLGISQIGCCCHRHNIFRVQNSPCCCAPAAKACCEPAVSYKRFGGGISPIVEPPMAVMPQAVVPQAMPAQPR